MLPKDVLDPFSSLPPGVGLVGQSLLNPVGERELANPRGECVVWAKVFCVPPDNLGVGGRCLWVCQGGKKIFLKKD